MTELVIKVSFRILAPFQFIHEFSRVGGRKNRIPQKMEKKKKRTKKHENTQTIIHLEIKWYRHKHPMLCIMYIKEKIEIKKLKRYVNCLSKQLSHLKGLSQANVDNFSAHQIITESFKISKEPVASTCRRTHRESKHEHG